MAVTDSTRLLSPEEIAVKAGEQVPYVRLPERASVFADRALRLRQLAAGHAMRDFLVFAAQLAEAQHAQLQAMPELVLPDADAVTAAAHAGQPPLPADAPARDAAWRGVLRSLLQRLQSTLPASPARTVAEQLAATSDEHLEQQADRLLGGVMRGLDLGTAPLIGAALQLCWTHRALELQRRHDAAAAAAPQRHAEAPFGRTDDATACPCCGSRPTSSITRIGADAAGYRYLNCSLCSTQWHMVRIKCTHCESTKGIGYQQLEPLPGHAKPANAANDGAVQAETCTECGHYLKVVHMERDQHVEPVADDLATLTLDLLVSEAGLQRQGVNLMLLFGDPEPAEPEVQDASTRDPSRPSARTPDDGGGG